VTTTAVTVLGNLTFDPANIQVSPGATVTWTWAANAGAHDVTFPSTAIADSGARSSGTFSTTMPTTPGTYAYSCTLHAGMNGSVLVQ
jgi:plastocyanin